MSTISDLFAEDPLKLTREDRSQIIEYLRKQRAQYNSGEKPIKEAKPKEPKKALSIGDLEL